MNRIRGACEESQQHVVTSNTHRLNSGSGSVARCVFARQERIRKALAAQYAMLHGVGQLGWLLQACMRPVVMCRHDSCTG